MKDFERLVYPSDFNSGIDIFPGKLIYFRFGMISGKFSEI